MKKILLTTMLAAFVFVGCGSDDSNSGCNLAALENEYEAALEKYQDTQSNEDCLAVVNVIKKAFNNKCISKQEADTYGAGLPCYNSEDLGGNNGNNEEEEEACNYEEAVAAYVANPTDDNCNIAYDALYNAVEEDCLTEQQAFAIAEAAGMDCL